MFFNGCSSLVTSCQMIVLPVTRSSRRVGFSTIVWSAETFRFRRCAQSGRPVRWKKKRGENMCDMCMYVYIYTHTCIRRMLIHTRGCMYLRVARCVVLVSYFIRRTCGARLTARSDRAADAYAARWTRRLVNDTWKSACCSISRYLTSGRENVGTT